MLLLLLAASWVWASQTQHEVEPNDTPAQANPVAGAVTLYGTMPAGDQDGFIWTVSDDDARKRWDFELHGIPGALTIAEVARVEYAGDGESVAGVERLMKMGTRDGTTPSVHRGQLFEPGEYLVGLARAGGGKGGGGLFRPPMIDATFGGASTGGAGADGDASGGTGPTSPVEEAVSDAWRLEISEGVRLNVQRNPGPRGRREDAQAIRPGRGFATFEPEPSTWYRFDFDQKTAEQRWDIEVRAPIGRDLRARLVDADGRELIAAAVDTHGLARFADLAPSPGTWYLELATRNPGFIHVVESTAVGQRVAGAEAEPNNSPAQANRVDFSQPVSGRMENAELDYFRFTIDEAAAGQRHALRVETSAPIEDSLCLYDGRWERLQCRTATTPFELPDLQLAPGDWGVSFGGKSRQGADYRISLEPRGPLEPGREAEPNDTVGTATGMPSNQRIRGRMGGPEDIDVYRIQIAGEPQLWRFQVIGDGFRELAYLDGQHRRKAQTRLAQGERRARLDDLYLLPGTHYLRVSALGHPEGGDYVLMARPLGPPDPDGELEPNDALNKQRLAIGQTRTGLLANTDDSDYYRFYLANPDHIRLTITPSPDGRIKSKLYWYDQLLKQDSESKAGEPVSIQGVFPPGDYHVLLEGTQPSDAEYSVQLERLPRFSCPSDCEPNGGWLAAPLPSDLVLQGTAGNWRDTDAYQLPAFEAPATLLLHAAEPVATLSLTHRSETVKQAYDPELPGYRMKVPAGGPYRIVIGNRGAYRLEAEFPDGQVRKAGALPARLALSLAAGRVAAFRAHGQRLGGELLLENTGDATLDLRIEFATSHHRWSVDAAQDTVSLAPGARASVPVTVRVPADAWSEDPLRVSVRAVDAAGRQQEAWQDLAVLPGAPSVGREPAWPIPDALRGGFNVAWEPFGASWENPPSPRLMGIEKLRDGLVFSGDHMRTGTVDWEAAQGHPAITLRLPGDAPLPVAGIAVDLFGANMMHGLGAGALLLSEDGEHYSEALRFETLPILDEQHFALEKPRMARYARLRFDGNFGGQFVSMGEWKVILEPGFDLSAGAGFNLADPALGGHLVWASPAYPGGGSQLVLTAGDPSSSATMTRDGLTRDYVIGFHQGRAARVSRVEWSYPESTDAGNRVFERIDVSASLESPVGPWLPLGTIDASGARAHAALELAAPAWARFVRLTAHRPDLKGKWPHDPGQIRILEVPTGGGYLSALTEWGSAGPRAGYELQQGVPPEPELSAAGNTSRDRAARLQPGQAAEGAVALQDDLQHWYRLRVPDGRNTLLISLSGEPTVRTEVAAEDADGNPLPVRRIGDMQLPGRHRYEAIAEPGSEVFLRVFEPVRNVVLSWDTSGSIGAYRTRVYNAMATFAGQVVRGRESVNLMQFGAQPMLRDWLGEAYLLRMAVNDSTPTSSSSAEWTLKEASRALAPRAGSKAIVVITDAQTPRDTGLWDAMREVQPRIFSIGVAGNSRQDHDLLRDWAMVNGGHFTQLRHEGELDVAYARATALMHDPADYRLQIETEYREAPGPGRLRVQAPASGTGAGAAVELILDASGSMLQRMGGKRRIDVAREVLTRAVREHIPAGTPLALRVFGHREAGSCRTDLEIPLAPLDPATAAKAIAGIRAMNLARTPIADSLAAVESDLQGAKTGVVVLVTDGEETCDGDPGAVLDALRKKGFDVRLNIVGFAIDDAALAQQFEGWAAQGGGRYVGANDPEALASAMEEVLRVPYRVLDRGGNVIAEGLVGGDPVEVEQGVYRVVVDATPARTFEDVEIPGEQDVSLSLE